MLDNKIWTLDYIIVSFGSQVSIKFGLIKTTEYGLNCKWVLFNIFPEISKYTHKFYTTQTNKLIRPG